jgi:hypothetical protein
MTTAPLAQTDDAVRFPSLVSLRAAHNDLLKRYRATGDTPDTLAAVQQFIQRGRATGALLDAEADRWAAQTQLDYWSTQLYRPGQIPLDATLDDFDPSLAPELDDALCPYLGLDAFHENNQRVFFGRERLIGELVKQLKTQRWLSVLGSSGSGKSSVVRAGLIPALAQGALPDSAGWFYFPPMVPGSHPLANLARLILPPEVEVAQIEAEANLLRQDSAYLTNLIAARFDRAVVLVIDQFEEIFTLCTDEGMRRRFVDNLIGLGQTSDVRHRVIITMRTDFETHVTRLPNLQVVFEASTVRITPLNAAELREAIEAPAALIGLKFEEGVVDALLNDTLGEPAALPLLQFTLLKLWEGRERNRVTWEMYKKLGGGRQALARSADEFYNKLIPEEQVTMRRILLKLVRPGEGLEVTSNRVPRAALYQKAEAHDRIDRVLDRLIKARLVRVSEGDTAADEQVEVAHEALVRNWPRLVEWLEEERVTLRQRQRLTAAAEQWERLGKDPQAVWRGALLDEARRYDDLDDLETGFVQAGRAAEEAARRTEQSLQVTQRGLRRARRFNIILIISGLLVLFLMIVIFRPYINGFDPIGSSEILGGQSVTLGWETSPFVQSKLIQETTTPDGATVVQEVGSINEPTGTITVTPTQSTRYRLVTGNMVSSLLPFLAAQSEWVPVTVRPVPPVIEAFDALPASRKVLVRGASVNLVWRVLAADKLTLVGSDGTVEPLSPTDFGSIEVAPTELTTYTLSASNIYGTAESKNFVINVVAPPSALVAVASFAASSSEISLGRGTVLRWSVNGVDQVAIVPLPGEFPATSSLSIMPITTTVYTLVASDGKTVVTQPLTVTVKP